MFTSPEEYKIFFDDICQLFLRVGQTVFRYEPRIELLNGKKSIPRIVECTVYEIRVTVKGLFFKVSFRKNSKLEKVEYFIDDIGEYVFFSKDSAEERMRKDNERDHH